MTRFNTRLENSISLSGDWEVGLVEMQYTRSWNNMFKGEGRVNYVHSSASNGKPKLVSQNIRLPPGYYESPTTLVNCINKHIQEIAKGYEIEKFPVFNYNTVTNRLHGDIPSGTSMTLSRPICLMLGIETRQNEIRHYHDDEPLKYTSANVCDVNRGFNSLFVYCNLLEHVLVGNAKVPLLRIIPVSGKNGENVHIMHDKPQYVPLQQKHFDSLEIDIRNDIGQPVPFEFGKVVITLHFRLRKIPYLLQ